MKNNKQRPRASALTDAETGGMSTFRESLTTNEQLKEVAIQLVGNARKNQSQKQKVGVFGVLRITHEMVTCFQDVVSGVQYYCIYDTAMPELQGHSDVFQRVSNVSVEHRDQRRTELFARVATSFVPVNDYRNGLLMELAPVNA